MPDCMTFPDTVEEFMEQYKVVDTKQVYTNGTEFVPIYRMRQWFQHEPEIIRCKDCKYFELDHFEKVGEFPVPIIVAHEICMKWSDGCRTSKDGWCFMGERRTDDL